VEQTVVGEFRRPISQPLTIRILHWLKPQGKGYWTRINSIPREAMENSAVK
jgi:uncharacterized protein (DUF4415 family)